ncbi:hypothetical protein V8E53_002380 [Lactarius tabidus]
MPAPAFEALGHDIDMQTTDPGPDVFSIDIEFPEPLTSYENMPHIEGNGPEEPDEDLDKFEQDTGAGNDGNISDIPLEDGLSSDKSDIVDRDQSDQQCICDELGEDFESRYAMIAEKLDESNHTICQVFAFKVSTYMADAAWKKAYIAFQTMPPLPKLLQLHSCIIFLAGDELGCLYTWENNPKQPNPGLRFKGGLGMR